MAGDSSGSNTENDNSSTVTPAPVNGADGYSVYTFVCNGKNNFKKQKETVNGTKENFRFSKKEKVWYYKTGITDAGSIIKI